MNKAILKSLIVIGKPQLPKLIKWIKSEFPKLEHDIVDDDNFFSEFSDSIEEFEQPQAKQDEKENYFQLEPEQSPEPVIIDPKVIQALNKDAADMLVSGLDVAGSFVLSHFVAKNDKPEDYILPKEQRKKIVAIIQKMMPTEKTVMPNWMLLTLTIANTYGELTAKAVLERQVKEQAEKIKKLENKLKEK